MLLDQSGDVADDLCVENRIALGIVERRNRHAPRALTRDAPIRSRLDGALDAVDPPVRNPVHAINFGESGFTKGRAVLLRGQGLGRAAARPYHVINLDEPLIHCAKDDRRLAPPTVRVAVMIILLVQQRLAHAQFVQHGLVRVALAVLFQNGLADHLVWYLLIERQIVRVREAAIVVHRRINQQAMRAAEVVVVLTVAGRNVNEACARIVRDEMVAGKKFSRAIAERMLIFELTEMLAVETADDLVTLPAAFLGDRREQHRRDDELFLLHLHQRITELGVVRHGQIRRQGPRRRRPDYN